MVKSLYARYGDFLFTIIVIFGFTKLKTKMAKAKTTEAADQQPAQEQTQILKIDLNSETEQLTGALYDAYCEAVGGKAFNGDPLPDAEVFLNDPEKQLQANAWRSVAVFVQQLLSHNAMGAETEETEKGPQEIPIRDIVRMAVDAVINEEDNIPSELADKYLLSAANLGLYLHDPKSYVEPDETDDDDETDEEHILAIQHIENFGLKLNKSDAMRIQHHVTRIAVNGTDQHEVVKI